MYALVLAPAKADERLVTGLTLGERGRRVARLAGIPEANVRLARSRAELDTLAPQLAGNPLLLLRATDQVVAAPLVEPLLESSATNGSVRVAVDPGAGGVYAGAIVVPGPRSGALLAALLADFTSGDATFVNGARDVERFEVTRRARHPARTPDELRAADAWQFELVNKPLDAGITRYVYRPLARPLTRMFLRLPFSPNQITLFSAFLSLFGCWIAAGPGYGRHVLGLVVLFAGGIVDCNDGEVARLRLEFSKVGGWLDAIGDDLARGALLIAMGWHVAPLHPTWPVMAITWIALALTVASLLLIYWYCIFVIHSSNNQDYGQALGVGSAAGAPPAKTIGRAIGDFFAHVARRDAMDLGALGFAILAVPTVPWVAMAVGGAIGFAWVVPTHFKIVRQRRIERERGGLATL